MTDSKKIAVIGGGAAGFFAGINAARLNSNFDVTIFEKSREPLSKVRISGGGRCNVTHHCFDPEIMARAYPRGSKELRWAYEQFQAKDTVQWFEDRDIELKTESDGRMFPTTDDSATIIDCLKKEARRYDVDTYLRCRIEGITPTGDQGYKVKVSKEQANRFDAVIIAMGGSNRKKHYRWLKKLGHRIVEPVPSLFTFNFEDPIFEHLAGISVDQCSVAIEDTSFEHTGPILITHWGLSAPAVLKTSSWAARYLYKQDYKFTIRVNWLHPHNEQQVRGQLDQLRQTNAAKTVAKQDQFEIPNRLWKQFLEIADIDGKGRWAELTNTKIQQLAHELTNASYQIKGKTTYKDEFVTSGGIPLNEVNMGTMESKESPGIYFAGEVLNIDGITGGYNFQSAWTTGWIAAQGITG